MVNYMVIRVHDKKAIRVKGTPIRVQGMVVGREGDGQGCGMVMSDFSAIIHRLFSAPVER